MARSLRLVFVLLLVSSCSRGPAPFQISAPDPATLRNLAAGDVVGGAGRYDSVAWLGIPYAKPPVGERRWRAPEPMEPWNGRREALAFGAPCMQYGSRLGGPPGVPAGTIGGSEDCLTLNVWTPPHLSSGERLPVFVWIHGGGNTIGHASFFDGGHLAAAERLVVVTLQYRIGPFGWFRHPALGAEARDAAEASGNFGLLDLVRALAWVRDNVAGFGGDPANVTIAGESAGALNVYALLLAPQAHGLFHRAVIESGGLWFDDPEGSSPADKAQAPVEIGVRLMKRDQSPHERDAALKRLAALSPGETASWLRARSARDVLAAYEPLPNGMIEMPRVVRDGAVLPAGDPLAALARPDGWNRVPVLVGTNHDENKLFMFAEPALIRYRFWIVPRFVDEASYQTSAEYLTRVWKAVGADAPASVMTGSEPRVFVYRFDWKDEPTILGADLGKMLGAAHAFEIPFVFGHFDLGREGNVLFTRANEPGRLALSKAMMSYWASFARAGSPGARDGLAAWEPWGDGRFMVLDSDTGGGVRMAAGVETRERVLADLDRDPRLPTGLDRCRMLRALAEWAHGLTRAEYAARAECAAFPYDQFPWIAQR